MNHKKKKQNQMSKDEYEHSHVKQGLETWNSISKRQQR